MTIFLKVNAQNDKKIIEDAWVYLDSWANYKESVFVDLAKSWKSPTICVVSFEKGLYSVSDENGQTKEKGKWVIRRIDNQDLIIIKVNNGQTIKFHILSVDNKNIKLRRLT